MSINPSSVDVAIIGAGPWGLGLAAHLTKRGIVHRIFGTPMQTWREMPKGMNLKSLGFATNIPTPDGETFPEYCRARGLEDYEPIEFQTFAEYGMKIQREQVPHVEDTRVTDLQRVGKEFQLTLKTGERLRARRVVMAVGLAYFQRTPEQLKGLPSDRVAHTWGLYDFSPYVGKDVVIIGGGSSALETGALLHEQGARVQILARSKVNWGGHGPREWERSLIDKLRAPISTIGHGRENWVIEHVPYLMHFMPAEKRIPFTRKHLGPLSAWWLRDRVEGKFPIHTHTTVTTTAVDSDRITLRVNEQGVGEYDITADYIISGTGYEPDVDRIDFLSPALARQIARYDRAPKLSMNFESSVPGLYFIGPIAALSFGPLVRFVAGSYFAVPALARHLAARFDPLGYVARRLSGLAAPAPEALATQTKI